MYGKLRYTGFIGSPDSTPAQDACPDSESRRRMFKDARLSLTVSGSLRHCFLASVVAAALFLLPGAVQAQVTVDNFLTQLAGGATGGGGLLSSAVNLPQSSGAQSAAGILGTRTATVDNNDPVTGNSSIQISGGGTASLATSADNSNGSMISLNYTFSAQDFSAFPGAVFNVTNFDPGTGNLPTLVTTLTDTSSGAQTLATVTITGNGLFVVPFGFSDRNQTTALNFKFNLEDGADFVITNEGLRIPQEVPEPATLALWAGLAVGGVWYARRKTRS